MRFSSWLERPVQLESPLSGAIAVELDTLDNIYVLHSDGTLQFYTPTGRLIVQDVVPLQCARRLLAGRVGVIYVYGATTTIQAFCCNHLL